MKRNSQAKSLILRGQASKNPSEKDSRKEFKKGPQKRHEIYTFGGPFWLPWGSLGRLLGLSWGTLSLPGRLLGQEVRKGTPKSSPRESKRALDRPKLQPKRGPTRPRRPKRDPKIPERGPRGSQGRSQRLPKSSKESQKAPRTS